MEKYFITDDTALAAYLYLCGLEFVDGTIWGADRWRKKYVIYDTSDRAKLEEDFYLRKTSVAPLDYHDARIAVSRLLKREVRDPRLPGL